jgi:hypothetical protein
MSTSSDERQEGLGVPVHLHSGRNGVPRSRDFQLTWADIKDIKKAWANMSTGEKVALGLGVGAVILAACGPALTPDGLPSPVVVTRDPGTGDHATPTIGPAPVTPGHTPVWTATPGVGLTPTFEATPVPTLVPFREYLSGSALALGGPIRQEVVSQTSVLLVDNAIREQFNALNIAPVVDVGWEVGTEVCTTDQVCISSLTVPAEFNGLRLDPQSPRTNEMTAAYVDPATGREAGYLVRAVKYDINAREDYAWGVQTDAQTGLRTMVLVGVEKDLVRVVKPANAFFPADPDNPPSYDPQSKTLVISNQVIVGGVEVNPILNPIDIARNAGLVVEGRQYIETDINGSRVLVDQYNQARLLILENGQWRQTNMEERYGFMAPREVDYLVETTVATEGSVYKYAVGYFTGDTRVGRFNFEAAGVEMETLALKFVTRNSRGELIVMDITYDERTRDAGSMRIELLNPKGFIYGEIIPYKRYLPDVLRVFDESGHSLVGKQVKISFPDFDLVKIEEAAKGPKCDIGDLSDYGWGVCAFHISYQAIKEGLVIDGGELETKLNQGGEVTSFGNQAYFQIPLTELSLEEANKIKLKLDELGNN